MSKTARWLWTTPNTYQGALLDAVLVYAAVLLTAAFIDEDGWRGGLFFGAVFAGVRLLLNLFSVWNSREPEPE